jgi:hypothetical protein
LEEEGDSSFVGFWDASTSGWHGCCGRVFISRGDWRGNSEDGWGLFFKVMLECGGMDWRRLDSCFYTWLRLWSRYFCQSEAFFTILVLSPKKKTEGTVFSSQQWLLFEYQRMLDCKQSADNNEQREQKR